MNRRSPVMLLAAVAMAGAYAGASHVGPSADIAVAPRRGPAPPTLTRRGYVTNPIDLHKLARKNKRRGRR